MLNIKYSLHKLTPLPGPTKVYGLHGIAAGGAALLQLLFCGVQSSLDMSSMNQNCTVSSYPLNIVGDCTRLRELDRVSGNAKDEAFLQLSSMQLLH